MKISILPILEDIQIVLECDILHSPVSKSVNSNHKCYKNKKGFKRTYQYRKFCSHQHDKSLFLDILFLMFYAT